MRPYENEASDQLNGAGAKLVAPEQTDSDRGSSVRGPRIPAQVYGLRHALLEELQGKSFRPPTESFFESLKDERVHATRYRPHQDAKADLFDYIEVFYNRSRRYSSLGLVSPKRFLRDWFKAQQTKDVAA